MVALQQRLRASCPPWLRIGGDLQYGEIPWFWCWLDGPQVKLFAEQRWPFICGPNILFHDCTHPGGKDYERAIVHSPSCLLQFTESEWYATLIKSYCQENQAPIVLWSYPIEPRPGGPLAAKYDVLIYHKLGPDGPPITVPVCARWHAKALYYGDFTRGELYEAARRSRCCLYLSATDRGPLALAEIMLAGCPAVGVPMGSPWVVDGKSGFSIRDWSERRVMAALTKAMSLDRREVRAWAMGRFSTRKTVDTILSELEKIAVS